MSERERERESIYSFKSSVQITDRSIESLRYAHVFMAVTIATTQILNIRTKITNTWLSLMTVFILFTFFFIERK